MVSRTTWSRLSAMLNGEFILTVGNHFIALRKNDGCLEVNFGRRTHEWQSACRWQTSVPIGFAEDIGQWLIDPVACSGLFIIQDPVHVGKCRHFVFEKVFLQSGFFSHTEVMWSICVICTRFP